MNPLYVTRGIFANNVIIEPSHKKANCLGFILDLTQTGLYSQRIKLEA